jgi:hypothetical protein
MLTDMCYYYLRYIYTDNIEVRTVNVNGYLLLLFKVYLDNIEVRTVNVNRYLLLLFKVHLYR